MITQSIFVRITLCWLAKATVAIAIRVNLTEPITADRTGSRGNGGDSVSLPAIPMASEESVHLLTAVQFPPPALFFANPNRKWALVDFEKPDRTGGGASYWVTDQWAATETDEDATATETDRWAALVTEQPNGGQRVTISPTTRDNGTVHEQQQQQQPPLSERPPIVVRGQRPQRRRHATRRPAQVLQLTGRPLASPPITDIRFRYYDTPPATGHRDFSR